MGCQELNCMNGRLTYYNFFFNGLIEEPQLTVSSIWKHKLIITHRFLGLVFLIEVSDTAEYQDEIMEW